MMAMLVGTLIAAAASRLPAARSLVIAGGMLFAALVWAVMQYGIWRAVDAPAAQAFTPWVFAVAHGPSTPRRRRPSPPGCSPSPT